MTLHRILFCIALLLCSCQGALAGVQSGIIVIGFKPDAKELLDWKANNRSGTIPIVEQIVGSHTTEGYISNAVLKAVAKRVETLRANSRTIQRTQSPRHTFTATTQLGNICIVRYTANIAPEIAASKLKHHPSLRYAEPLYTTEIVGLSNDPLASEQYHLALTKATLAWDEISQGQEPVVVGIVDTGTDTAHVDLRGHTWNNPGEVGTDNYGRDKRYNKVDDDDNGFVDDWYGWDFVGADGATEDNSPLPGNDHGTHVSGLVGAVINNSIGVAGMSPYVRLLPVKVGRDNPSSRSVERSGDGIVYAAAVGASVINCSFGSSSPSFASLDVVTSATEMGALVVAAAGNASSQQAFYPAAHPPVLSVAATDKNDERAYFSNFHNSVDVSAPGVNIVSTIPGDRYLAQDGTSMASPIVAGAAALVKYANPSLTPMGLHAVLKANTDNIDSSNVSFVGLIGTGRINVVAAAKQRNPYAAEIIDVEVVDPNNDGAVESGETIEIHCKVHNLLAPINNARVVVSPAPSTFQPIINVSASDVGFVATGDTAIPVNSFVVTIPSDAPLNGSLNLFVYLYVNDSAVARTVTDYTINPTYRTLHHNNIAITVSNAGNLGYNDYPANSQGVGVTWKNGPSLAFEGGLLIGTEPTYLPNVVRGADASFRDNGFRGSGIVDIRTDNVVNGAKAITQFSDSIDRYPVGVLVRHQAIESSDDTLSNSVILTYDITNTTSSFIGSLYTSLFFDWDLGDSGSEDGVAWDNTRGFAVVQNTVDRTIPTVGVSMISGYPLNIAAIDNQGGGGIPSIYDGFIRAEKWLTMSRGKLRTNSNVGDVSLMIGGGPISLAPGETKQIAFTLAIGSTLEDVTRYMASVRSYAQQLGINAVPYQPSVAADTIEYLTNAPSYQPGNTVTIGFALAAITPVEISIVDLIGCTVDTPIAEYELSAGSYQRTFSIPNAATGVYFVVLRTYSGTKSVPVQILQ